MNRKMLTDGTRRWFDADKAEELCRSAKSQSGTQQTEVLYLTAKQNLFVERCSYDEALKEVRECREVTPEDAVTFLIACGKEPPEWLEFFTGEEV